MSLFVSIRVSTFYKQFNLIMIIHTNKSGFLPSVFGRRKMDVPALVKWKFVNALLVCYFCYFVLVHTFAYALYPPYLLMKDKSWMEGSLINKLDYRFVNTLIRKARLPNVSTYFSVCHIFGYIYQYQILRRG